MASRLSNARCSVAERYSPKAATYPTIHAGAWTGEVSRSISQNYEQVEQHGVEGPLQRRGMSDLPVGQAIWNRCRAERDASDE